MFHVYKKCNCGYVSLIVSLFTTTQKRHCQKSGKRIIHMINQKLCYFLSSVCFTVWKNSCPFKQFMITYLARMRGSHVTIFSVFLFYETCLYNAQILYMVQEKPPVIQFRNNNIIVCSYIALFRTAGPFKTLYRYILLPRSSDSGLPAHNICTFPTLW